jgi:hypothetical protein
MIGFGRFDKEQFLRSLTEYSDLELIKLGRAVSPAGSRWADPMTLEQNAAKYELKYESCKKEWRRRHPKLGELAKDES